MPLLSLLLPTYNQLPVFQNLIHLVLDEKANENPDMEIIVSNNCSPDGTKDFLDGLRAEGVSVYHQPRNLGLVGNLRFLGDKANGKYCWFLGDNDIYNPGIFTSVLNLLKETEGKKIGHYYLNYSYYRGEERQETPAYRGSGGFYADGFDMFADVSAGHMLGALMFISANIYRADIVRAVNGIVRNCHEEENLALPLGYSVLAADFPGYVLTDTLVKNEASSSSSSWAGRETQVYSRDMIAIHDLCAQAGRNYARHKALILRDTRFAYPEWKYAIKGRKFPYSNYAMDFYRKNAPLRILEDALTFPFWSLYYLLTHKILRRKP